MTQPREDDVQLSETAPEEGQAETDSRPAAESGDNAEGGEHGRPSDDSDPGHS